MKKLTTVLALTVLTGLVSCKKYEEGPSVSFQSKKARVSNTWEIEKLVIDGDDLTSLQVDDYYLKFSKDGGYESGAGSDKFTEGNWEFTSNKENIKITGKDLDDNSDIEEEYVILKLKSKEMKLGFKDDNDSYIELK